MRTQTLSVNKKCVFVSKRGNPVLKHIRSVPWEFGDIVADYEMGTVMCALFLSLRYHNLNPNYIHERLKLLGRSYDLRVLLVQVSEQLGCIYSGGSRIQDFPDVGGGGGGLCQHQGDGAPNYYLANFPEKCMKMKKFQWVVCSSLHSCPWISH